VDSVLAAPYEVAPTWVPFVEGAAVLVLVLLCATAIVVGARRRSVLLAALCVPFAVVAALILAPVTTDVSGQQVECGTPMTAAFSHGVPDDSGLNDAQVSCKEAGVRRVFELCLGVLASSVVAVFIARRRTD
jgi:hypothetical protein